MDQTIKALKDEIKYWDKAAGSTEHLFLVDSKEHKEHSPLCKMFRCGYPTRTTAGFYSCVDCPVYLATNRKYCLDAPAGRLLEKIANIEEAMKREQCVHKLVREARGIASEHHSFLQGVLRNYEKGDNQLYGVPKMDTTKPENTPETTTIVRIVVRELASGSFFVESVGGLTTAQMAENFGQRVLQMYRESDAYFIFDSLNNRVLACCKGKDVLYIYSGLILPPETWEDLKTEMRTAELALGQVIEKCNKGREEIATITV